MPLSADIARSHLETLIERITGIPKATPDEDGDYLIPTVQAGFFARVDGTDKPVFRVYSVVSDGVEKTPELLDMLNDINSRLAFLRVMWVREQVMMESEMLALTADIEDFLQVCQRIASASDQFGPELIRRFGGRSLFEASKVEGYVPPRPEHPGYL